MPHSLMMEKCQTDERDSILKLIKNTPIQTLQKFIQITNFFTN